MTLENWMYIFDRLDEILQGEASTSKKSKIFDTDNGRLTVKAKWMRTSDLSGMGSQILKILNSGSSSTTSTSSASVGKHFLKIDIKLNSNFQRLLTDLEQRNKLLEEKNKTVEPNHDGHNSVKQEDINSTEVLPKKEKLKSYSSLSKDSTDYDGYEDSNVEEYIPTPTTATSIPTENCPTYNPEKNSTEIEINKIQSEYSPTFLNANASVQDTVSYRPSRQSIRTGENDNAKKLSAKKSRIRGKSKELFGTSEEDDDEDIVVSSSSSSQHKSKRKKETSPRKETKSHREKETKSHREKGKSKKKKTSDSQCSQDSTELSDISIRYNSINQFLNLHFVSDVFFFLKI